MNAKSLLGPDGLNVSQPPLEIEQEERFFSWNDPRNRKKREKSDKHIRYDDPMLEQIEEKVILKPRAEMVVLEDSYGTPCPECHTVVVVSVDGCAHCKPSFESDSTTTSCSVSVNDVAHMIDGQTRKINRARTVTNPRIGNGGFTRLTSPHMNNRGWKPSAAIVQKMTIGSREAHWGDPSLQKKIEQGGFGKIRKNTIAKICKLEARKEEKKSIAKFKGKL